MAKYLTYLDGADMDADQRGAWIPVDRGRVAVTAQWTDATASGDIKVEACIDSSIGDVAIAAAKTHEVGTVGSPATAAGNASEQFYEVCFPFIRVVFDRTAGAASGGFGVQVFTE